ncbi:MAG: symmetrical bis(5'-nucleosyl)-tetraphosphatase [Gammaproteobacteria bacterium]|nr:symmetrical bis(5'-nucleosyl)-tetraphosphatase [Gammaproteobacteria bacterium]
MATYAIGDVQGCYDDLMRLLDKIRFNPDSDTLWFCGDIINRGPKSLQTLRFIKQLGARAITVLGNHDLHFLAVAYLSNKPARYDTLDDILKADDRPELIDWLRQQKLFHHDPSLNISMVHAGIPPQWTIAQAQQYAEEVERLLQTQDPLPFFKHMYGNYPPQWRDSLKGWDRYRFITNALTRMRFCDISGRPDFKFKGDLGSQPVHLTPWFMHEKRRTKDDEIIFGHWSTLSAESHHRVYPIDTGCLWSGSLSALRIDTKERELIQVDCPNGIKPPSKH